jgi:hypothetical protein
LLAYVPFGRTFAPSLISLSQLASFSFEKGECGWKRGGGELSENEVKATVDIFRSERFLIASVTTFSSVHCCLGFPFSHCFPLPTASHSHSTCCCQPPFACFVFTLFFSFFASPSIQQSTSFLFPPAILRVFILLTAPPF